MNRNPNRQHSGLFNPRAICAFIFCLIAASLAMLSVAAPTSLRRSTVVPATSAATSNLPHALSSSSSSSPLPPELNGNSGVSPLRLAFSGEPPDLAGLSGSGANALPAGVPAPSTDHTNGGTGHHVVKHPLTGLPVAGASVPQPALAEPASSQLSAPSSNEPPNSSNNTSVSQSPTNASSPTPEQTANSPWSIVSSPSPRVPTNNFLPHVACTSANDCWAVGYYDTGWVYQTLVQHWDGTAWTIATSRNTSDAHDNALVGVTCAAATDCWAVGYYEDDYDVLRTLIERWNGASWDIVASPSIGDVNDTFLEGVTCTSSSNCWAVGSYFTTDPATFDYTYQTVVERWDGSTWSILPSGNTTTTDKNFLLSVACSSVSDCSAVGYVSTAGPGLTGLVPVISTLIEHWDGNSWSVVTSPEARLAGGQLNAITCVAASTCWAVGTREGATFIEQQQGSSWSLSLSPNNIGSDNRLFDVTCVSSSACWAVGASVPSTGGIWQTLVQRWDGLTWTIAPSANTSTNVNNTLWGIACPSQFSCVAVGVSNNAFNQTMSEVWDGNTWTIVLSPDQSAPVIRYRLNSVTCVSTSDCWAVGQHAAGGFWQTLAEHWDGNTWTVSNSLNNNRGTNAGTLLYQNNAFYGIACTSSSKCWAVGVSGDTNTPLIERWDGTAWSVVAAPTPKNQGSQTLPSSVTCNSASDCWAAGYYQTKSTPTTAGIYQTLLEHWDGSSWTVVSSPNSGSQDNFLSTITCVSATDCWTGGFYLTLYTVPGSTTSITIFKPLTEHWDGRSWSIVPSIDPGSGKVGSISSIACTSASDCWAAGLQIVSGYYEPLIQHWDGNAWNLTDSPQTLDNSGGAQPNVLSGIACESKSNCWAVGSAGVMHSGHVRRTLTLNWDGSSWRVIESPNTSSTEHNSLNAVTCLPDVECWAVGSSRASTSPPSEATLVEHYIVGASPTPTATPSTTPTPTVAPTPTATPTATVTPTPDSSPTEHWAIVPSPDAAQTYPYPNSIHTLLNAVTCESSSDCWAVGYSTLNSPNGAYRASTLAEHWNGGSWIPIPSPNGNSTMPNRLTGVTCVSPSDCWAVGYSGGDFSDSGGQSYKTRTLAEHWDGKAWAVVSSPSVALTSGVTTAVTPTYFDAITCVSTADCWAVGYYVDGRSGVTVYQTVTEHWNGSSWVIVSSPNVDGVTGTSVLNGITCTASNDCWAVGYYDSPGPGGAGGTAQQQVLIEHWDGNSWTINVAPVVGSDIANTLNAVTCVSSTECWAVGQAEVRVVNVAGQVNNQTLVERWDGNSWTAVASLNATDATGTPQSSILNSITCASGSDCLAVGEYVNLRGTRQPLVEHWDGQSWKLTAAPHTSPAEDNALDAVVCRSSADCWAVGAYFDPDAADRIGAYQALTEHFGLPPAQLTGVVSRKTHGTAGAFDVDLLSGTLGIEPRSGGTNGNYTLVFNFANPLSSVSGATLTSGTGSASGSIDRNDAHNYIVNLSGVTNAQTITVSLTNVSDSTGTHSPSIAASMGVLLGDTNADGVVNSADISQTKSQSGQTVSGTNFREDLNGDGNLNSADISFVKSKSGTALP